MEGPDDRVIHALGFAVGIVVIVLAAWGLAAWVGSDFGRSATFMLVGYLIGYLVGHWKDA